MSNTSIKNVPAHVAIIMDGNGRWAGLKGLSRLEGHSKGASKIESIVRSCKSRGISYLTLYAFSEENWDRPSNEVEALMQLAGHYLDSKRDGMLKEGVRFLSIGDRDKLPKELKASIDKTIELTKDCKDITLIVALSYGSRQELIRAIKKMVSENISVDLTPEIVSSYLDTSDVPDPDLLIRTSGEYRISNFLLWQLAYTELFFTDVPWPEFGDDELDKALEEYSKRERRFGKI
ncbi:MAG: polyprenyl diphosphate synthase [Pseudomonadota bacterium]